MKFILLFLFILIIIATSLTMTPHAHANACAVKLTSYTTPQFFLLSDTVFSGTVLHVNNTTDHQWKISFTVDKIWKGSSEKPLTVITNTLQGCGYYITSGEKYLVYASGYQINLNPIWTKSYADAQSDIALLNDPKFQVQAAADEELYKKLTTAQNMLSHTESNQSLPIFMSDVDEMTLTLVVGMDDTKTPLLSADEYQKMVKNTVGNIPVKIVFGHNEPLWYDISGLSLSPLKQFKSGIKAEDVKCQVGLQPIIKSEDGSPACVTPNTASKLVERGWMLISMSAQQNIPVLSNSLKISNANYTIDYNITGNGKILDIKQDTQSKALILSFATTSNGTLTVSVPRALLDMTKSVRGEGSFGVLADGREANFTQTRVTATDRIFSIPFTIGTHEIEIFVTQII